MSLPKSKAWLLTSDGQCHAELFKSVRLDGITDPSSIDEMQKMNIIPPSWMLQILQNHYYALQGGGDMSLLHKFESNAIRYGYIIDENGHSHSEIVSLHGFYFEFNTTAADGEQYNIFIKRLRPNDPNLPFRMCERQTFSMRQDREVRYSIKAMWNDGISNKTTILDMRSQCFGFGSRTCKSEMLQIDQALTPIYIMFSLMFPPF